MFYWQWVSAALLGIAVSLLLASCVARVPMPAQQLSQAQAAMAAADKANADQAAPDLVGLARQHLSAAQEAIKTQDYRRATWLLEDAEVEARLARGKAGTAKTRQAIKQLDAQISALQKQLASRLPS